MKHIVFTGNKKLIMNSYQYSGMGEEEKEAKLRAWEDTAAKTGKWTQFVKDAMALLGIKLLLLMILFFITSKKYGWYRYDSRFAIAIYDDDGEIVKYNVFKVRMVIRYADDGKKYLYDLINIKKESEYPA